MNLGSAIASYRCPSLFIAGSKSSLNHGCTRMHTDEKQTGVRVGLNDGGSCSSQCIINGEKRNFCHRWTPMDTDKMNADYRLVYAPKRFTEGTLLKISRTSAGPRSGAIALAMATRSGGGSAPEERLLRRSWSKHSCSLDRDTFFYPCVPWLKKMRTVMQVIQGMKSKCRTCFSAFIPSIPFIPVEKSFPLFPSWFQSIAL